MFTLKGCLVFLSVVVTGLFLCMTTMFVSVDRKCVGDAHTFLPDYPGAEVIDAQYSWIHAFGIGETTRTLYTPDDRSLVIRWYQAHEQALSDEGKMVSSGYATVRRFLSQPEGGGTIIRLYSQCETQLVLW